MSENTKKRCRKSKLVPRICDFEDSKVESDDAGTSEKALPSILQKFKQEIENEEYNTIQNNSSPFLNNVANPLQNYMTFPLQNCIPSTPMQFSVKVEVEECDDLDLDIKDENFADVTRKFNNTQDSVPSLSISDIDISKEADELLMKAENINLDPDMSQECTESSIPLELASKTSKNCIIDHKEKEKEKRKYFLLSKEDILSYQPDPNDIAGKMLFIEVRNILARAIKSNSSLEIGFHDTLIQTALLEKQLTVSQYKDSLFMYKCYICTKAWWHLYPFREHIRQHREADLMVSTESNGPELNMIAYIGTVPGNTDIEIDSNCWHCGKIYAIHKKIEGSNKTNFDCLYCTEKFPSCIQLITHEGVCFWQMHKTLEDEAQCFNCPYCLVIVISNSELQDHLVLRHSVRSDVPMPATFRFCPYCKGKYFKFNLHTCPKRSGNKPCLHCNRKFPNNILRDAHLMLSKVNVKCPICGIVLAKECMMMGHLLMHSNDFTVCSKCVLCTDIYVFLDVEAQRDHRIVRHKMRYDRRRIIYEMVLIPKKLLVNPCQPLIHNPDKIMMSPSSIPLKNIIQSSNKTNELNSEVMLEEKTDDVTTNVTVNDESVKDVTEVIKVDHNESEKETPNYESIIQINEIGSKIIIKTEQNEIEPDNYNNHISDIKQEVEDADVDIIESNTADYEQLLSNVFRVSENFSNVRYEVKTEPRDENIEEDLSSDEYRCLDSLEPQVILEPDFQSKRKRKIYECNKCGYKNYYREYKLHLKNNCEPVQEIVEKNAVYGCTKCNKSYSSMKIYIEHFTQHGYNCYTCPVCLEVSENPRLFNAHISYHVRRSYVKLLLINQVNKQKRVLQCKKCKEKVMMDNFFAHWESHLELGQVTRGDEVEKCEEDTPAEVTTALEPETMKELIKQLVHTSRRHQHMKLLKDCNVCHRHFDRVNNCKIHLIEHLLADAYANKPQNKLLKCQICCEGYWTADKYKQHMRDHGSLPIFKCELCNKTFSDSSNFTKHKKVHNLLAFICDICGKKFQAKISIEKHMKMHLTTGPIKCNLCPKVFHIQSLYKKHLKNYHDKTKSKFKCLICLKWFNCLKDKWDHMWIAHKERKKKVDCPICNKSFRKFQELKSHVKNEHKMYTTVLNMKLFNKEAKKQMIDALEKSLKEEKEAMQKETLIVFE